MYADPYSDELSKRVREMGQNLYAGFAARPLVTGRLARHLEAFRDEVRTRRKISPLPGGIPTGPPPPSPTLSNGQPAQPPLVRRPLLEFLDGVKARVQQGPPPQPVSLPAEPSRTPGVSLGPVQPLPMPMVQDAGPVYSIPGFAEIGSRARPSPIEERFYESLQQVRARERREQERYLQAAQAVRSVPVIVPRQGRNTTDSYVSFADG